MRDEDVIHPIHKPGQTWARCPVCEATGVNRFRLTIVGDTVSCREGCDPGLIRKRLSEEAP